MATVSSLTPELTPERSSRHPEEVLAIDASLRTPVVALLGSALVWLLISGVLAIITTWKLHTPSFLEGCEFVSYGRVQPAQSNAFLYGWGCNIAFAVSLWVMARLSRAALPGSGALLVGTVFWNLGVTLGVGGILFGHSTSIEWLEMPGFVGPLLLVAYALIAAWALVVFRRGRSTEIYASQWYIFAALFWFPWIYSIAQVMLIFSPARGTVQSVVHAWFTSNLFLLWFASVALAALYYFLPKLLLKPVSNYYLARFAFWWLAVFGSWTAGARLIGGPVPAWVQTVGAAASFMLVVPFVIFAMNHYGTLAGRWSVVKGDLSLRFLVVGIFALSVVLLASVAGAIHAVAEITQFTYVIPAQTQLGLYGFFSMVVFGAAYYIVPRVLNTPWASVPLANVHFWASLLGVILFVSAMGIGGVKQGLALADAGVRFADVVAGTRPYLFTATVALVILAIGQIAFALNFFWTLSRAAAPAVRSVKTLLAAQPEAAR